MNTLFSLKTLSLKILLVTCLFIACPSWSADIATTYQKTCGACHDSGALGAPKKGDKATWSKLKSQKGMDALVKATRQGMPQMPAMGLCQTCSDDDLRALIEYMAK